MYPVFLIKFDCFYLTIIRLRLSKYSSLFTVHEANNCFSIITQVFIREKIELSEKCQFCLFVSNCHSSMNRNAQSADKLPIDKLHMPQAESRYS